MPPETFTFAHKAGVSPLHAFQRAVSYQAHGRSWEAEQLFQTILKEDDRHFGAIYRLGLIRLQNGRFADAAQFFRRAIKIDKESADAHFHLAVALSALGRLEEAVQRYQKTLVLKPAFVEALNNLGHALQMLGRHDDAAMQYEKALAIAPGYAEARNNLGNALQMLGRSEEAIEQYGRALGIRPNYAEAYNNLGNVLAALQRYEEATVQYEKALAIRPKYADAHFSFGNALNALGRRSEAISHYESVLVIQPEYAEAHFGIGKALLALGRHEEAIAQYDKALAIAPDHIETISARGQALMRVGEEATAARIFEALLSRGCRSVDILLALACVPASAVSIDLLPQLANVTRPLDGDAAKFESRTAFVRAVGLERDGRYSEAWEQLGSANRTLFLAAKREFCEEKTREQGTLQRLQDRRSRATDNKADCRSTISLFILGPSRSGKTTLEKLVSALPGVKRGYENPSLEEAVRRTFQLGSAALPSSSRLEDLPPEMHPLCRDLYVDEVARWSRSANVFTSTNPARIHDADIMAATFLNVRFLCLKRNVEDNVLRIYQRVYNTGNIYAYDLQAAYDHVLWYHRMMDLLEAKFQDIVRVIHYEDMVIDPAAAVGVAADLCGLSASERRVPGLHSDMGCAAPYRQLMETELAPRLSARPRKR